MNCYIGLDIGTSSVKAVLMNENGEVLNNVNVKHKYYFENDLKLLNADEFCEGCFEAIKQAASVCDAADIKAVCASGAAGNLMLAKDGKAITPVYGWQNGYDADMIAKYMSADLQKSIYDVVGWGFHNSFPLGAYCHIKEHNPELVKEADMVCMHIEYLNYKLTGKWGITLSMGTPFYFINQTEGKYYQPILDSLGVSEDNLPPIMKNFSVLGEITGEAAEKTGLKAGTNIVLGFFDHPSAAMGAGVLEEGEVLVSCGTSWVVFIPYKSREIPRKNKMLIDRFLYPDGCWGGMVSIESISDKIEKYKKTYLGNVSYTEFDELAKNGKGQNIDFENDSDTEKYSREDIARSIMEYIAGMLKNNLDKTAPNAKMLSLSGGIANSKVWLNVIGEVTKKEIKIINGECAGALGAAIIASKGR